MSQLLLFAPREEGGRGWEVREISTLLKHYPLQRQTLCHSFQSCWLAMDLYSQHCLHALYMHMHSQAHTYTHIHIHYTCCSCKWYYMSSLMCAFPLLSSAGERLVATKDSPPLWNRCLGGKLLLGKEKSQKHFSFGQANYSAGIMHYAFMWRL